jgi:hypothetical protein
MRRMTMGAVWMMTVLPCTAHHSFAMFDRTRTMTLEGMVREFQWTNPHCYLQVLVQKDGGTVEWSLETHSPADMYRFGWRPDSFRPGDKVIVVINPVRDGTPGVEVVTATDPQGRVFRLTSSRT